MQDDAMRSKHDKDMQHARNTQEQSDVVVGHLMRSLTQ
jgi:hypothetical protein